MYTKLKEVMEDLDEVMALIKTLGEATPDNVDSLREDIKFTHNKIKSKYGEENPPETNPS